MRTIATILAALWLALLGGCAATRLDAVVHTHGQWPPGRAPGSLAFERLPSQMAQPQEQDRLEAETLPALAQAGFRLAVAGEQADVRVQVAARIIQGQVVYTGPYWGPWGGPWGSPWGGPWGGARWGGPGWGWGWGPPPSPWFLFELALLIVDGRTGQSLYETRAQTDGAAPDDGTWAALALAAMKDFPLAAVSPRRVTIDLGKP